MATANPSTSSHSKMRPVQHLLAALSFEHILRHDHSPPTNTNHNNNNNNNSRTTRRDTRSDPPTGSVRVQVHNILHGTLDPDGDVRDVFYDAQEHGDGDHRDEFRVTDVRRESVVLPSIRATRGGFEALPVESDYDLDGDTSVDVTVDVDATDILDSTTDTLASNNHRDNKNQHQNENDNDSLLPSPPPPPPQQLPLRFLRAGKNDVQEGLARYRATLDWRQQHGIDTILREPHPHFQLIKQHYPHYYHRVGTQGEPVYYEFPPRTNLNALRAGGVTLEQLLRHYALITEFQWQFLCRDDLARSITVIDLSGIRLGDFVGEVVEFVKKASDFTAQHYPERAGYVYIVHVPAWFKLIWNVVKPWVDPVTLEKIFILRGAEVQNALLQHIAPENLPPEYGGTSMPLGQAPEERLLWELMEHNNNNNNNKSGNVCGGPSVCRFCAWRPARSY